MCLDISYLPGRLACNSLKLWLDFGTALSALVAYTYLIARYGSGDPVYYGMKAHLQPKVVEDTAVMDVGYIAWRSCPDETRRSAALLELCFQARPATPTAYLWAIWGTLGLREAEDEYPWFRNWEQYSIRTVADGGRQSATAALRFETCRSRRVWRCVLPFEVRLADQHLEKSVSGDLGRKTLGCGWGDAGSGIRVLDKPFSNRTRLRTEFL